MKILVCYATSEGQTRKIARHVADRVFDLGHAVELLGLADSQDVALRRFDRVILAGSVHVGHYQRALVEFVSDHATELAHVPTLFLSVSLTAAGHDAEDWLGLERIKGDMQQATGWTPEQVEQVAGAYMPSQYDMLRRFAMRRIVGRKDPGADLDADKEYTDWDALDARLNNWLGDANLDARQGG